MAGIFGKAKRGFGKALRPRGPGVIRPKPTDRYGQTLKPKPIRPGKKDGGKIVGDYVEKKRSEFKSKRKLKPVKPSQKGLQSLPRDVRNKMGYMKKGGKVKKFPDLTGDGKVTRADILKGRGVFAAGGKVGNKILKEMFKAQKKYFKIPGKVRKEMEKNKKGKK